MPQKKHFTEAEAKKIINRLNKSKMVFYWDQLVTPDKKSNYAREGLFTYPGFNEIVFSELPNGKLRLTFVEGKSPETRGGFDRSIANYVDDKGMRIWKNKAGRRDDLKKAFKLWYDEYGAKLYEL